MSYLEFTNQLLGYYFYDKATGEIIHKYELFIKKLTPSQVYERYNSVFR